MSNNRICQLPGCNQLIKARDARVKACSPAHGYELRRLSGNGEAKREKLSLPEEHKLRRENRLLREQIVTSAEADEKLKRILQLVEGCTHTAPHPPEWTHTRKSGRKQAIPTAFLSDMHYGEVVDPAQVEWMNGYDRPTAEARTEKFFRSTVQIARDYLQGLDYPGIVLPLGGDTFSGDIHEELEKTNAGTIQQEILYWIDPMLSGIKLLADEFGKVFIPAVVGNHPRSTRKPSHKMRVPNNFDWLFYKLLAKFLAHDKRVTFQISDSADVDYSVYATRNRLSHGDQFKGGSGIAGALSPMMIGDARKRQRAQQQKKPYDVLVLGHWHQYFHFRGIICNGSLKGLDEYAYHNNFPFEPPRHAFWLTDPEHGVTISAPIHCLTKGEFWMREDAQATRAFAA